MSRTHPGNRISSAISSESLSIPRRHCHSNNGADSDFDDLEEQPPHRCQEPTATDRWQRTSEIKLTEDQIVRRAQKCSLPLASNTTRSHQTPCLARDQELRHRCFVTDVTTPIRSLFAALVTARSFALFLNTRFHSPVNISGADHRLLSLALRRYRLLRVFCRNV